MRPHRAWMILVLAIAASASPASAQTPQAKPSGTLSNDAAAMNDKARDLFKEGNRHYRAEKWAQAEAAFEAAWALTDKKSKGLVNNLGQTEMHLGKFREAAEHLSAALRLADQGDKQLPDIERDLAESKKHIGTLVVTATAEGAQILLGNVLVGQSPLLDPVFVEPGKATLSAFKEGFSTVKVEVEVTAGQELPVTLTLEPPPPPPPTASVTATAPPPPPPRSKVPAFVIGGVGVASLIVGGVLVGIANGDQADIKAKSDAIGTSGTGCPMDPRCSDLEGAARSGDAMSRAGVGLLIGGVVLGAAAGAYLLWPSGQPRQSAIRVVPVASQQGGGLIASGNF